MKTHLLHTLAAALAIIATAACRTRPPQGDPLIAGAVAAVSPDSVRTYIDELVSLHTRHTLSTLTDPGRGLGAAVDYLAGIYVPDQEVVLNYRQDRYRRGGDHSSFLREGFTAVRVCEYCEDYERTHQDVRTEGGTDYGDLADYIDFTYLCRNIRINLASVMNLAMAPARPGNAVLANAMELDNNTVITWDPVPGEGVSYQVLCRETDRSEWAAALPDGSSGIVPAGGGTSFSCPFSKDNYYFAVRAVSPGRHPGLPSLAR